MSSADPTIAEVIERSLGELQAEGRPGATAALVELAEMVEAWGARMNLTGHRSAVEIADALIADAIGLLAALERHGGSVLAGRVIDLGSGAGFPGLPWAIVRPSLEVYMVEVREKRHFFQRAARREIGIPNAHPIHGRIEDRSVADGDWVVAQAVGPIDEVARAMRPYAREGGRLVIPGGEHLTLPAGTGDLEGVVVPYRSPRRGVARQMWVGRIRAVEPP